MKWAVALVVVGGCETPKDTQPSPPAVAPPGIATRDAIGPIDAALVVDAAPDATIDASIDAAVPDAGVKSRPAKVGCRADAKHCCLPGGRIVATSGCDPLGGGHGYHRTDDGTCRETFCRCLPGDALIATPRGDTRIDRLEIGDLVYTTDAYGRRITAPIASLVSVPFDVAHPIHEVTLSDGRFFRASPGHPLVDGTLVGAMRVGTAIDGAIVSEIRTRPIDGPTWDLLPASATRTYWADGVHLGSTLRAAP